MPSYFADGKKTNKYDPTVPTEVVDVMMVTQDKINEMSEAFTKEIDVLKEELSKANVLIESERVNRINEEKSINSHIGVNEIHIITIEHFLRSKFMRFLNFFGHWFIYGSNGSIEPNMAKLSTRKNSSTSTGTRGHFKAKSNKNK